VRHLDTLLKVIKIQTLNISTCLLIVKVVAVIITVILVNVVVLVNVAIVGLVIGVLMNSLDERINVLIKVKLFIAGKLFDL
jgi:hypothetical protein